MKESSFELSSIVFVCTNQRTDGRDSCGNKNACELRNQIKKKIGDLQLQGSKKIRVSTSGCLGKCEEGIAVLQMPQKKWYLEVTDQGADKIVEEILLCHS